MNGYASTNAAITVAGHKKSLPAASPLGIFMDLGVLARAPPRMVRAGIGDSLCRSTAQADWLLSHHVLGTPYRHAPFALLAADEPGLLDEPEALLRGDLQAMRALARTLVLSGLGMTICGGSFPASQGEHLISHYIDMFAPADRAPCLHGEQVAVATLTMARLQDEVLAGDAPRLNPNSMTWGELRRRFGSEIGDSCWREFDAKRRAANAIPQLASRVARAWDEIRGDLRRTMLPATRIASVLGRAGCPVRPEDIGVSAAFYAAAVRNARFLRDRYTFLDLADDCGRLAQSCPLPD
jgi:glycerol-1-phosphate dehydrogenase [NAD(P)+]